MLGSFDSASEGPGGVGEGSGGVGEGSGESEVGGIVIVLISLLVKGLMVAISAFSKYSVLSMKGLTTIVEFFSSTMCMTFIGYHFCFGFLRSVEVFRYNW